MVDLRSYVRLRLMKHEGDGSDEISFTGDFIRRTIRRTKVEICEHLIKY